MSAIIKTWRERINVGADFPLHAPTDVERAMVAEIAELRAETCSSVPARPQSGASQCIVLGGQRISTQHLLDLQRDAARYRWLRDKADGMACTAAPMVASLDTAGHVVSLIDGDELDAAVDMAAARGATRTKRARS